MYVSLVGKGLIGKISHFPPKNLLCSIPPFLFYFYYFSSTTDGGGGTSKGTIADMTKTVKGSVSGKMYRTAFGSTISRTTLIPLRLNYCANHMAAD